MGVRIVLSIAVSCAVIGVLASSGARAQDSKINTNLGAGVTVPLNPLGQFVGPSGNIVVGIGYNFDRHNSFVGQFMWAGLNETNDLLRPIRLATKFRDLDRTSNLFALTANYRLQKQGKTYGAYLIAGGGLYYRQAELSREIIVGRETVCGPSWTWWGFTCTSGFVTENQTLFDANSAAGGGNAGAGFTIRLNEEGYKFYIEARYHYARTSRVNTQFIPITLGISW